MKQFAVLIAVLATGALADLHYTGLCYDSPGKDVTKLDRKSSTRQQQKKPAHPTRTATQAANNGTNARIAQC
ncbi:hypothetical protein An01g11240 [Aspergillus niger]|uniref:Uncharacterized protein n=2 Tax=Aspergillus niger TaxID=5061 RepID=A2QAE7_ASPNC|nr:hypothetical protein An01g11240 [Aspergillus niger]CAK44028.1 hypothetical protein An01g11240 [Aspergillus niger]